ncbi:hypothetical protein [Streptococcus suis]|uniref:hypothetical protein n=1 Tax=Streptococcus suis TaxID=1307 RepID=UPI001290092C|nr:hypothetical protein [Streptococcus suis]MCO8180092.1 hypothetical protein [Streptococcus suis]HEM3466651.1 hypothetical protein [Streptococcus suis]
MDTDLLSTIEGGGCSVREADRQTLNGMIMGLIGGIPGGPGVMATASVLSGIGARVGYYMVCWT